MILKYEYLIGFRYNSSTYTIKITGNGIEVNDFWEDTNPKTLYIEKHKICAIEIINNDSIRFGYISFGGGGNLGLIKKILNYHKVEKRNSIINDLV